MTDIEIDEVLIQAKLGLWNVKMTLVGLLGCALAAAAYVFAFLAYGEMAYECKIPLNSNEVTIAADHCSYTFNNITTKCENFVYIPGAFESTFVSRYDLVCDRKHFITYNTQLLMISQMISICLCNMILDIIGRKATFVLSCAMLALSALNYIIAPNVYWALVTRSVECVFSMSAYVSGYVLIAESLPPKYRIVGSTNSENFFGIGISFGAIVSLINPNWEFYLYARLLIPSLLVMILGLFVIDESPKWLLQKQRYNKVSKIIQNIYRLNGTKMPPQLEECLTNLHKIQSKSSETKLGFLQQLIEVPFWQLFQTRRTAMWMGILTFNWIACVVVYYGLLFSPNFFNVRIQYFFLINGISTVPACAMQYTLANKFGRRIAIMVSFILTALSLIAGTFMPKDGTWIIGLYLVACTSFMFMTSAFATIYMWHSELMPTFMRAVGMGIGSLCGRISGIFMPPIMEYLGDASPEFPILFLASIAVCATVFSIFAPETRNQLLPDNIEEFQCYGTEKYAKLKEKRRALVTQEKEIPI